MMRAVRAFAFVPVAVATITTACSRRQPSLPATAATEPANAGAPRSDSIARAEVERRAAETRARLDAERADRDARMETIRRTMEEMIYFEFDRSDLSIRARSTLEAKLDLLRRDPTMRIQITGHADERGSDEYNLALGQQRAAAAKRFLAHRGIDGGRIEIVSLGEEQPRCQESVESCWAQNRRDEFTITAASEMAIDR